MATTPTPHRTARPVRSAWLVILLCWLIVVFDGYDLIVYGTTLPSILAEPGWGLSATAGGLIGSLAFLGMLVEALAAGRLADALGRRRTILWCTLWFSLFTALCYVAPNAETFGAFRLIAGLGLGGLVPSANALTTEFVSVRARRGPSQGVGTARSSRRSPSWSSRRANLVTPAVSSTQPTPTTTSATRSEAVDSGESDLSRLSTSSAMPAPSRPMPHAISAAARTPVGGALSASMSSSDRCAVVAGRRSR
ncbi:MFS transporter [Knoellia sp. LjRoot47]|uniref:MFS transporter n=1 Tax=Knoellia sp. LjRoot47 TaxID=3342330 RepID=UPI003ECD897C